MNETAIKPMEYSIDEALEAAWIHRSTNPARKILQRVCVRPIYHDESCDGDPIGCNVVCSNGRTVAVVACKARPAEEEWYVLSNDKHFERIVPERLMIPYPQIETTVLQGRGDTRIVADIEAVALRSRSLSWKPIGKTVRELYAFVGRRLVDLRLLNSVLLSTLEIPIARLAIREAVDESKNQIITFSDVDGGTWFGLMPLREDSPEVHNAKNHPWTVLDLGLEVYHD